jgi:hypothetical protein
MKVPLHRYPRPLRGTDLPDALRHPGVFNPEPLGIEADFDRFCNEVERCYGDQRDRASWDARLVEPLHRALRHLSRRLATDMGLWHWLCTAQFRDLVWRRWSPENQPASLPEQVPPSVAERFLGSQSLRGFSRNALSRLWWAAECLVDQNGNYMWARRILEKQDLFQAIFERRFGLYPPAARACLKKYWQADEQKWREGTKWLNHYLTTLVAESLAEDEILALLP